MEERLTSAGPVRRVHPVGFTDAMSGSEVALAAGMTEGAAWRKVRLGADLGERFPMVRDLVLTGEVSAVAAHKVLDGCDGLDVEACLRVDEQLAPVLACLDPGAVTRSVRQVATRVAADQVAATVKAKKRTRCVEVSAAEDGLSSWWAVLPTATAAAAWSAVEQVAADYRAQDDTLTVPESRADAFGDLLLRDVTVTANVTLGVPVLIAGAASGPRTSRPSASPRGAAHAVVSTRVDTGSVVDVSVAPPTTNRPVPGARPGSTWQRLDLGDDEELVDHDTGEVTRAGDLPPQVRERLSWVEVPGIDDPCGGHESSPTVDPRYAAGAPLPDGSRVSGAELPGLGWVDSTTVAALFDTVPLGVARAVLDAGTGTLVSHVTDAYTPTKAMRELVRIRDGVCRMWGCTRAATAVDLDHVRPWPTGATTPANLAGLCRRHHRMKQRGRWRYRLHPDGTIEWVSQNGQHRPIEPFHRVIPPPEPRKEPTPHSPPAETTAQRAPDELPPF